jgi:hypothetical protein
MLTLTPIKYVCAILIISLASSMLIDHMTGIITTFYCLADLTCVPVWHIVCFISDEVKVEGDHNFICLGPRAFPSKAEVAQIVWESHLFPCFICK